MSSMGTERINEIYRYCEMVFDGQINREKAAQELCNKVGYSVSSHKMYFEIYRCMMLGQTFRRATNTEMIDVFLNRIHSKKGEAKLKLALKAVYGYIQYYYGKFGQSQPSMRSLCQAMADKYKIKMSFDMDMFSGISAAPNAVDDDFLIQEEEHEQPHIAYTKQDFLDDVFMYEEDYNTIVNLLKRKRNIILQGAPGVGKTYTAKKIAYSLMGEKDYERVMMIQFHQSYSYEDFVIGYRPSEKGFEIKNGPFYEFCKSAEADGREHYFIIDEINRGNLSKIFGELLMLIESDKRGQQLRLLYSDEQFSVPTNVYIIGIMNTADRSLAIIDYALRRRFSFFSMEPQFNNPSFITHLQGCGAEDSLIKKIIKNMNNINEIITQDVNLGKEFCIGHSYFCDYSNNAHWYEDIVKYEIKPLLEEYYADEPSDVVENHVAELLR